jgi:alpha-methylacyl-CoA racemase
MLVVDLTRYLPGAFASRELQRLGARVVRLEPPEGDPRRHVAPAWDDALNGGKESVACDLKAEPELARALLARADVVLEGFRPGVAARLGVGPDDAPESAVYCSITGFGSGGPHTGRAGHDLNYIGWAGLLEDTAPSLPPLQPADLAAGALGAVAEILDGRHLTVGALEPKFFSRLCELIGRPELAERQLVAGEQEALAAELASVFSHRPLAEWLALFDGEDVCVGPVATLAEAAEEFGEGSAMPSARVGQHTERWWGELGLH